MHDADAVPEPSAPHPTPSFADRLRTAIEAVDLPLDRIRHRLVAVGTPVSTATLSHWQTGRSAPNRARSLPVVRSLEAVLRLEPGELVEWIPEPRPRGRGTEVSAVEDDERLLDPLWGVILASAARLGVPFDDRIRYVTVHQHLDIGPDRVVRHHVVRAVVRSAADAVDRMLVYYRDDVLHDVLPLVDPRLGCRLGGSVHDTSTGGSLTVTELVLPATLAVGDRHLVEYEVRHVPVVDTVCELRMVHPLREALIAVSFRPEDPPATVVRRLWRNGRVVESPVALDSGGGVVVIRHDLRVGMLGLRWAWPD